MRTTLLATIIMMQLKYVPGITLIRHVDLKLFSNPPIGVQLESIGDANNDNMGHGLTSDSFLMQWDLKSES